MFTEQVPPTSDPTSLQPPPEDMGHALYQKGVDHRHGVNGADKDERKAFDLIREAHEQKHANAIITLMEMHRHISEEIARDLRNDFKGAVLNEALLERRVLVNEIFGYLQGEIRANQVPAAASVKIILK